MINLKREKKKGAGYLKTLQALCRVCLKIKIQIAFIKTFILQSNVKKN